MIEARAIPSTMSNTVRAPQQYKQPSRKGRKAWRKNVDITPVQQGLESLREEIRQGGPIAEKPSEDIFVVDLAGSEDIKKKHRLPKPLKADQILAERSAVPAVDGRKRTQSRLGDGIYEPSSKRQRKDWVSKKEVQRLKQSITKQSHLDTEQVEDNAAAGFDLWDSTSAEPAAVTRADEYIPKPKPKVAPRTISQPPTALTAIGKPIKAVRAPDAGTSYNPSFDDWDDLLNREGAKELSAEQARQQAAEAEAEKEARLAAIAAAVDRDGQSDYESAWSGFETENEEDMLKAKRPKRKTPAQQHRAKRRIKDEQLARHEAATKAKQKRDENIASALTEINDKQSDMEAAQSGQEETTEAADDSQLRRRKLGKVPIPEKPLELVLPDELQESLRRLKPEGNLMGDRFRNLLVNGKIESRKPVLQPRKKRVKLTEKWSYKDFEISV